jgi:transcriptional regulator with XRE-family HTH domain
MLHTAQVTNRHPPHTFWDRLEEASRDVGLPSGLSDIGRELDVWPSAVQKWRDGTALPAQKNLIALAQTRGVNVEWLLTGRGPKLSEKEMDAATRELLAIWTKLDKQAQERLLTAAKYEKAVNTPPSPEPPQKPPQRSQRQ